ncbi:hypothetical protein MPL1032_360036 [Mesorhizobium plurifarium]|uniref:Uncharacterized protein n=1 Tax=Mesorhizobium plurifarium TaxID=69974 RepID=A0A0K2W4C2_MESPL|nr:hypothetical protein MPL1032_360036 [Mesorhizobium plurifarium]
MGANRCDRAVITPRPGCRIKLLSLLCDRNHWWVKSSRAQDFAISATIGFSTAPGRVTSQRQS